MTIVGSCKSIIPANCNPKTINTEPKSNIKIGMSNPPKTFPADAQRIPITLKILESPSEKASNFIPKSEVVFLAPQTYAKINGNNAIEHGETDDIIPPKNDPMIYDNLIANVILETPY